MTSAFQLIYVKVWSKNARFGRYGWKNGKNRQNLRKSETRHFRALFCFIKQAFQQYGYNFENLFFQLVYYGLCGKNASKTCFGRMNERYPAPGTGAGAGYMSRIRVKSNRLRNTVNRLVIEIKARYNQSTYILLKYIICYAVLTTRLLNFFNNYFILSFRTTTRAHLFVLINFALCTHCSIKLWFVWLW